MRRKVKNHCSKELEDKMNDLERDAWQSFREVVHGFLGRNEADNYEDLVEALMQSYCKLRCRMSIKMHSGVRRKFSWGGIGSGSYGGHLHLVCAVCDVTI